MKKLVPFLVFVLTSFVAIARQDNEIAIIPQPVTVEKKSGSFNLSANTRIESKNDNADVQKVTRYLSQYLLRSTGYNLNAQPNSSSQENLISLALNKNEDAQLGKEGYTLEVNAGQVTIQANHAAGLFMVFNHCCNCFQKKLKVKVW